MAVFRIEKTRDYTVMSNHLYRALLEWLDHFEGQFLEE